jgi:hypothetical protein
MSVHIANSGFGIMNKINNLVLYLCTDSGIYFRQVQQEISKQKENGVLKEFIFINLINACNVLAIQQNWNINERMGRIDNILSILYDCAEYREKLKIQLKEYVLASKEAVTKIQ